MKICISSASTSTSKSKTKTRRLRARSKRKKFFRFPIAHAEGNYVCDDETFHQLEENNQIVFRYCDENGELTDKANPNGSRSNIAGICNLDRNVIGMMPHPERACEEMLGSNDGRNIFSSLTKAIREINAD